MKNMKKLLIFAMLLSFVSVNYLASMQKKSNVILSNKKANEKLIQLCKEGSLEQIKNCVEKEYAHVNYIDPNGKTPLFASLEYRKEPPNFDIGCPLSNVNSYISVVDYFIKKTKKRQFKRIKYLIEKGAKVNLTTYKNYSIICKITKKCCCPYVFCCSRQSKGGYDFKLLKFVVEKGAIIDKKNIENISCNEIKDYLEKEYAKQQKSN